MKKWLTALAIVASLSAAGGELSGVKVEDTAKVDGTELHLSGMAIRIKYMVAKVYVAALYTQQKVSDNDAVVNATTPRRMHLTMLRKVEAEDIYKSFVEGMKTNNSAEEMAALAPKVAEFSTLFTSFKSLENGDAVILDFLPGKGTQVTVKGKLAEVIPGDDFSKALLRIWFGKKPLQEDLRKKLLGV